MNKDKIEWEQDPNDATTLRLFVGPDRATVLISADKLEIVRGHPLRILRDSVYLRVDGKSILLSHWVAGKPPKGFWKDHKNHNPLDNTNDNLRDVTPSQNGQNKRKKSGTSSAFIGVYRNRQMWASTITVNGKRIHAGVFERELDAARQYDKLAFFHFGPEAENNRVLTAEERVAALAQAPDIPRKRKIKELPEGIKRQKRSFIVTMCNVGPSSYHGSYRSLEEAQTRLAELQTLRAMEREQRLQARQIERNAKGEAIIHTSASTNHPCEVIVDDKFWHQLSRLRWNWTGKPRTYPGGHVEGRPIQMHRYVWGLAGHGPVPEGWQLDHKNHQPADVRLANLRLLKVSENNHWRRRPEHATSTCPGVFKKGNRWAAQISINHKTHYFGHFATEEQAVAAYRAGAALAFPNCYPEIANAQDELSQNRG